MLNTLEQRLAPRLEGQIAAMSRTLDEREREEHARLKRLIRARSAKRVSTPEAFLPAAPPPRDPSRL